MRALLLVVALLSVTPIRAQEVNPTPTWVRVAGGPGDAVVTALASSDVWYPAPSFVAAVGTFENVLSFGAGGSPLVAPDGSMAAFVSVFVTAGQISAGELLWQRRFACNGGCDVAATAVAVQPGSGGPASDGGEVAVVGWAEGSLTVDGGDAPDVTLGYDGGRDGFVALYTREGRLVWAERMGGAGDALPAGAAFVSFPSVPNALRVSGVFTGDVTWAADGGSPDGASSAGGTDGFVASYGLNGGFRDALVVGSASDDALAGLGGLWVAGTFRDTLAVGADSLVSLGGTDAMALQLSATLAVERVFRVGGEGDDDGRTITYGDLYGWPALLSGTFSATLANDDARVSSVGGSDIFHVGIPEEGSPWPPWSLGMGSSEDDTLSAVAAGAGWYGDIGGLFPVAVGWTTGRIELYSWSGPVLLPSHGGTDGFAIGTDRASEERGTQVGGPGADRLLAATAVGGQVGTSIVVGGSFQQSLRIGTLAMPGQGADDDDAFVAFYPEGLLTAYYIAGEPTPTPATALRVAPNPSRGDAVVRLDARAASAHVTVRVHDALGRIVDVLHDGPLGVGEAAWALPTTLPAGRYLVRVTGGTSASVPVTVVR